MPHPKKTQRQKKRGAAFDQGRHERVIGAYLDLRGLGVLNGEGRLAIGRVMWPKLHMSDAAGHPVAGWGAEYHRLLGWPVPGVRRFSTGQLDGRRIPAHLQLAPKIRAVQIQPLLKEWTGKEPVSGSASFQGKLTMAGLLPQNILLERGRGSQPGDPGWSRQWHQPGGHAA